MEEELKMKKGIDVRTLTSAEIEAITEEARRLRARAFGAFFSCLGRAFRRGGRRLWSRVVAFGEARAAHDLYEELSRMNDRELADIGLTRSDIPSVVAGTFRRTDDDASVGNENSAEAERPEYRKAA